MARSTFYYYLKKFDQPDKNGSIEAEITAIYHRHKGRYGYRRITTTLKNNGLKINHKKVLRLMKARGLKSMVRIKRYQSYKGEQGTIARNLLKRNFKARKPNQKWVTDITEFAVAGKKLYFSPILDLYNSEVVSYTISQRPTFDQVKDMLQKAVVRLPAGARPILHSDQGWQYQMKPYQLQLGKSKLRQSMSRKGNCLDNAVMENFFAILKTELFYLQKFTSYEALQKAIIEYVHYYNNDRIKHKLKGLSPVQYRTQAA